MNSSHHSLTLHKLSTEREVPARKRWVAKRPRGCIQGAPSPVPICMRVPMNTATIRFFTLPLEQIP